jgi:hypothetical protein
VAETRRGWQQAFLLVAPALLAAALALLVHALGLRGTDQAAQTYRVGEVRVYGLVLWDSGWYGGNLPLAYSVVFPLIGALVGLVAVGAASAAVATYAFDRLAVGAWGRRGLASWYFAVSTMLAVGIGQLPYLSGEAFGLLALLALRHRRTVLAALLLIATALCSPLAGAFAALACAALALDRRTQIFSLLWQVGPGHGVARSRLGRWLTGENESRASAAPPAALAALVCAAVALAAIGALTLAFPNTGPFPYLWTGFVMTLLFCAALASPLFPTTRLLRWGAALYALGAVLAFAVPNALGGNAVRLAQAIGVAILIGLVTLRRPSSVGATSPNPLSAHESLRKRFPVLSATAAVAVVAVFAAWQWLPGVGVLRSRQVASAASATFYQPLLHQIEQRSVGPVRVEAVPTTNHWESAYLAPVVSLARGWERQLDVGDNPLFYRPGPLRASTYMAWLRSNGVSWVALPNTKLDYASNSEGALLRGGRVAGLTLVWSSPQWELWKVAGSPGLVSGPGRLLALDPDHLSLAIQQPSVLTVRIRYTNLWTLDSTPGAAPACVRPGPNGWTDVVAQRAGTLHLVVSVFGDHSANCPDS